MPVSCASARKKCSQCRCLPESMVTAVVNTVTNSRESFLPSWLFMTTTQTECVGMNSLICHAHKSVGHVSSKPLLNQTHSRPAYQEFQCNWSAFRGQMSKRYNVACCLSFCCSFQHSIGWTWNCFRNIYATVISARARQAPTSKTYNTYAITINCRSLSLSWKLDQILRLANEHTGCLRSLHMHKRLQVSFQLYHCIFFLQLLLSLLLFVFYNQNFGLVHWR